MARPNHLATPDTKRATSESTLVRPAPGSDTGAVSESAWRTRGLLRSHGREFA